MRWCERCGGLGQVFNDNGVVELCDCDSLLKHAVEKVSKAKRYHIAHMTAAAAYGLLSHCTRSKVGALLVSKENRPLLSGFNGTLPGEDNCCEESDENGGLKTKEDVIHAERNLLGYASKYGIPTQGCSIYVTMAPCVECSKQMIVSGIKNVYFKDVYRDMSGVEYLKKHGVNVEKIDI